MPLVLKSLLVALTLSSLLGGTAAAKNRPRHERRASLLWLLTGDGQLDKGVLEALGPDTDELLIDIANSPREAVRARVRALAGLGFYPSEATFGFLSSLLHERNLIGHETGLKMRRQAIRSLGVAFGDRGVDDLLALRGDAEPGIRQAVAQGLGDSGSLRALPVLELWLTTEQELAVRAAVDRAVSQLQGR
jgi:hypothetical protein